jgi:hypothetical protein
MDRFQRVLPRVFSGGDPVFGAVKSQLSVLPQFPGDAGDFVQVGLQDLRQEILPVFENATDIVDLRSLDS